MIIDVTFLLPRSLALAFEELAIGMSDLTDIYADCPTRNSWMTAVVNPMPKSSEEVFDSFNHFSKCYRVSVRAIFSISIWW